ncbi:hypothetical protein NKH18_45190 [Streptomyces sp. M10(2022)]
MEKEAPGVLTPGSGTYVPPVKPRVARYGSVTGLRGLVANGADHWVRFHFVYRGWMGPTSWRSLSTRTRRKPGWPTPAENCSPVQA